MFILLPSPSPQHIVKLDQRGKKNPIHLKVTGFEVKVRDNGLHIANTFNELQTPECF